jgi:hypothetical protein
MWIHILIAWLFLADGQAKGVAAKAPPPCGQAQVSIEGVWKERIRAGSEYQYVDKHEPFPAEWSANWNIYSEIRIQNSRGDEIQVEVSRLRGQRASSIDRLTVKAGQTGNVPFSRWVKTPVQESHRLRISVRTSGKIICQKNVEIHALD